MNPLLLAAQEVCTFAQAQGWEVCLIGGLAVQKWGEPRTTLDADLTLLADWGDEERYVDALLGRFATRIADAREFALNRRVLLLRAPNGVDVDVVLGGLPFEVDMVHRALLVEFAPGLSLPCCTPEDLLVTKLFASRPRDLADAEGVIARQTSLNKAYILERLTELAEIRNAPEIVDVGRGLLKMEP